MFGSYKEVILLVIVAASYVSAHPCPQDGPSDQANDNSANRTVYENVFGPPPSPGSYMSTETPGMVEPNYAIPEQPAPAPGPESPPPPPPPVEVVPQEGDDDMTLPCECVPYYLCDGNGTIIEDGTGVIDIREKPVECEHPIEICCRPKQIRKPTDPIKPPPNPKKPQGCGFRNENGAGMRITGAVDNEAQFGEFPWMLAVLEETAENFLYKCGGSLISSQVVLTAAHCVDKSRKEGKSIYVRAGEWDTQTKNEIFPFQQQRVEKIITHENYYHGGLHNDVALLFLEKPFTHEEHIDVICLPAQGDVILSPNCYATGWGRDKFEREGSFQTILKKIELPMVPRDECQERLRKTRVGKYFKLHESFVCAGGIPGQDTCKGDGGSPLVCPIPDHPGKYQQVGIVAWGIDCGKATPGVYVNVAHFRDWIDNHMLQSNAQMQYAEVN